MERNNLNLCADDANSKAEALKRDLNESQQQQPPENQS